jgi:hypothetical protein
MIFLDSLRIRSERLPSAGGSGGEFSPAGLLFVSSLGGVYRSASLGGPAERLTSIPAQYGSLAANLRLLHAFGR